MKSDKEENIEIKEKEASVKRQIKEHKKAINHIESSKTWRLSKPYQRIKELLAHNEKVENSEMRSMIVHLEKALYKAEEEINHLNLKNTERTRYDIEHQIRTMKEKGELASSLDRIVLDKVKHKENYQEALIFAARLYMQAKPTDQKLVYEKVLSGLTIEEIPEFMVRAGLVDDPVLLKQAASFRGSLTMRMRQMQLGNKLAEWPLDDKQLAYSFVKSKNIKTPEVEVDNFTIDSLPIKEGIVIKPVDGAGARGVYLVHAKNDVYDVKNSKTISNYDNLLEQMKKDLQSGAVNEDKWLIEELIYENKAKKTPARDIKFYSFYGKVGLILEIKRDPEVRQCWWTPDGERIDTGKYEESLFNGSGVTKDEIEMVEKLSGEIPAPFLRIDFLRGEETLIFGEFTPKPGNYEEFNQSTDQLLGDYFLDAEARLVNDLLEGKQFHSYQKCIKNY